MARTTELDEVRTLIEIRVHRYTEILRLHMHPLLSGALRDEVIELLLKQREARLTNKRKGDRIRATPPYDVTGHKHSRADHLTSLDRISYFDER